MQSLPGSVTLEILRHGPPHNQLLSPLTQYLALCGNYGATSVNVPYEHQQFLARLRPLMYEESPELRELQLQETSVDMGRIFERVPGLIAALSEAGGRELGARLKPCRQKRRKVDNGSDALNADCEQMSQRPVHLELILSASELALLPFELAQSPEGCPGSGRPLLLQSQMPLCLTRRVRHNNHSAVSWNCPPRILLAAASPRGIVPLQEHVDALVLALQPWIDRDKFGESGAALYAEHLTILPQATWRQLESTIAAACDETPPRPFTHVHILAHGVAVREAGNPRYGVQLHKENDPSAPDDVTAQQLALALRPAGKEGRSGFSIPTVVTLATCHGAGQGSVVGAGASVAHTLHEAGIPLVVASQFPLTFDGSIIMASLLYRGFLRGHDPRILLTRLRRELRGALSNTHDWASIVAYADFDSTLDTQLKEFRHQQAWRSAGAALAGYFGWCNTKPPVPERIDELIRWLASSLNRLKLGAREHRGSRGWRGYNVNGRIAATSKKIASMQFYNHFQKILSTRAWKGTVLEIVDKGDTEDALVLQWITKKLVEAATHYRRAYRFDRLANWARVQELSLRLILGELSPQKASRLLAQAKAGAAFLAALPNRRHRRQAARDRLEILILERAVQQLIKPQQQPLTIALPDLDPLIEEFRRLSSDDPGEIKSLFEQLDRYQWMFPLVAKYSRRTQQPRKLPAEESNLPIWHTFQTGAATLLERLDRPAGTSTGKAPTKPSQPSPDKATGKKPEHSKPAKAATRGKAGNKRGKASGKDR